MKETLYYNGQIITMDEQCPTAEAVLVRDGTIVAVGKFEELKRDAELVDLKGKTLLPGFIDGHGHLAMASLFPHFYPPPAGKIDSVEKLVAEAVRELQQHPVKKGKWLVGMGYDNAFFEGCKHPTSKQLDAISTEVPVAMLHISGHVGVLNTKAMELAGITKDSVAPEGGRIHLDPVTGDVDGLLEESALTEALATTKANTPSLSMLIKGIERAQQMYASYGITTAQEGLSSKGVPEVFRLMGRFGKLKLDVVSYPPIDGNEKAILKQDTFNTNYKHHFRIGGAKLLLDGSPQAKTAWFTKPYYVVPEGQKPDYCGYPRYDEDKAYQLIKECVAHNWQLLTHCNGDAASDQLIRLYEKALKETGNKSDLRPVMIHAQTVREDQLDEMKKIGMMPSFFHDHIYYWGDYHLSSVLGPERGRRISPLKSAIDREIPYTVHDDAPVITPNIMFAVHNEVNRITRDGQEIGPEFRVSIMDALKSVTVWGAYQYHEEKIKGSITPGKLADFVILEQNPLDVPKEKIKDIKVVKTIKEGKVIYS